MKRLFLILLIFVSINLFAQQENEREIKVGIETNILPFFYNGYHGSLWVGKNGYRARLVAAKADYPKNTVPDGFRKMTLSFYEIEFDIFFGDKKTEFLGWWLATGIGQTNHQVTTLINDLTENVNTIDIHIGIGYTFNLWKGLTVNPWGGLAWHTNFPNEITVGSEVWEPKSISPVGGLKIGYTIF